MNKLLPYLLIFLFLAQKCALEVKPEITHSAFFDISIDGRPVGRIIFGLYGNVVPKTVENFLSLCKGTVINNEKLSYKNSIFHRIIPKFMAQGGDIKNFDGTGSVSIYGTHFPDENFEVKHEKRGLLSMANAGKDTNGSQFFILFTRTPWLDGRHVVFGEIIAGLDILVAIEAVGSASGTPTQRVLVTDSGAL